jgi:hypothetical protein
VTDIFHRDQVGYWVTFTALCIISCLNILPFSEGLSGLKSVTSYVLANSIFYPKLEEGLTWLEAAGYVLVTFSVNFVAASIVKPFSIARLVIFVLATSVASFIIFSATVSIYLTY